MIFSTKVLRVLSTVFDIVFARLRRGYIYTLCTTIRASMLVVEYFVFVTLFYLHIFSELFLLFK